MIDSISMSDISDQEICDVSEDCIGDISEEVDYDIGSLDDNIDSDSITDGNNYDIVDMETSDVSEDCVSDVSEEDCDMGLSDDSDEMFSIEKDIIIDNNQEIDDISPADELEPGFGQMDVDSLESDKIDAGQIDVSQEIRSLVEQNVLDSVLPKTGGHWSGDAGNSEWIIDDDYEIRWGKGEGRKSISGRELKEKYGISGIEYHNNEPVFDSIEDNLIGHVELNNFSEKRLGNGGTYDLSTKAAASNLNCDETDIKTYMDERELTWHERGDRKTVQAVPEEINAAFKHTGGIGIEKSFSAISKSLDDRYGELILDRDGIRGGVNNKEINDAIEENKRINKCYK